MEWNGECTQLQLTHVNGTVQSSVELPTVAGIFLV